MNTLYYSQIDGIDLDEIKKDIIKFKSDSVVLFCETEWEVGELKKDCDDFIKFVNDRNIEITVLYSSFESNYYSDFYKNIGLQNIKLVFWPTFWVHWSKICGANLNFEQEYRTFKYPYICLNNKNHPHRCALIDELCKHNLLDKGVVSWQKFSNINSPYIFECYDDSYIHLGDDFVTKLDSFLIPEQWHESFLHVIGEATLTVSFISEKTTLPILYKKPWLVLSNQGWYKNITNLGFKLFDEIFDYSFDDEPDYQKRAKLIIDNVNRIITMDIDSIYKLLLPKLQHNYDNYMNILNDPNHIPDLVKHRALDIKLNNYANATHSDYRYVHICENIGIL